MGRPNELNGQVQPNTLSPSGGRAAPPTRTAAASTRPLAATNAPVARPAPSQPPAQARSRRPFSLWTLFVAVIIGFNLFRGFLASNSGGDEPTTAPRPTAAVAAPVATPRVTPEATSPLTPAGGVGFGTALSADCVLEGQSTEFSYTDSVWWVAKLGEPQEAGTKVLAVLVAHGIEFGATEIPEEAPTSAWDMVCAEQPVSPRLGPGLVTVQVWDQAHSVLLAGGSFQFAVGTP